LVIVILVIGDFLELSAPLAFVCKFNDDSIAKERSIVFEVELEGVTSDPEVTFLRHELAFEEFALADFFGVGLGVEVVGVYLS
jgi:hypothetical protein